MPMTATLPDQEELPTTAPERKVLLHISTRDVLRPIRDQVLFLAGFEVVSCPSHAQGMSEFRRRDFDLVLVDVEGEHEVGAAEQLCSEIKTEKHGQLVAFVCNWRVANLTDCPDEILRTEFDPAAFVAGVRSMFQG